jgi:diaminohydroxyphosphoribosylaminopyrimidine deaminase/5-amino-6-(5-phosphoribosylamino)uracil reductase
MAKRKKWSDADESCMRRAIELADSGRGRVAPNPLVGCVLAMDGDIIAEGWHDHFGGLHAEQAAIANAEQKGAMCRGSTAYITLEPCNHHGLTPPCTEALLWAGVAEVVVAARDPNPNVRGAGIEMLKGAGLKVRQGLLQKEAETQMQSFLHWCAERVPLVTMKIASDADGVVDLPHQTPKRFTSEASLDAVHRLRREKAAIIVGVNTVIRDNPSLTVRRVPVGPGRQPLRIILDRRLRTPPSATIVSDGGPTLILHTEGDEADANALRTQAVAVIKLISSGAEGEEGVDLQQLIQMLGDRGMQEILIEGGPETWLRFLEAGLVDRLIWIEAPQNLGEGPRVPFNADAISQAGLERVGEVDWDGDTAWLYSRSSLTWPAKSWP